MGTRENLINRHNFFEKFSSDSFTSQPDFIFEAKNIPQRDIFIKKMNYQISELLENSFFCRFLYKFSISDNAENIREKDLILEQLTGFSNPYEDIYIPKLLDTVRNCLS